MEEEATNRGAGGAENQARETRTEVKVAQLRVR